MSRSCERACLSVIVSLCVMGAVRPVEACEVLHVVAGEEAPAKEPSEAVVVTPPIKKHGPRVLTVSQGEETIARVELKDHRVVSMKVLTKEGARKKAFKAHYAAIMKRAAETGLRIKFHDPYASSEGERGALVGGDQKQGDIYFEYALYEHLMTADDAYDIDMEF